MDPFLPYGSRQSNDLLHERAMGKRGLARWVLGAHALIGGGHPFTRDAQLLKALEDRLHRSLWIPEELCPPDANKPPSHPLQHGLTRHVLGELLPCMVPVTVTFNGYAGLGAAYDQVNPVGTNLPLSSNGVAPSDQASHHLPLELGLRPPLLLFQGAKGGRGVEGIFDEASSEIAGLQVHGRIKRMDDP